MIEIRPCASLEELRDALNAIAHYFGRENQLEDAEELAQRIELHRVHAAREDGRVVGGAGAFGVRLAVPGGSVPAAGVTAVGVLPTHRRRNVLRSMMQAQLEDCRTRGDAVAFLWASEGTIYGRFGYGLGARTGELSLAREHTRFAVPFEPSGTVRLVGLEEAGRTFPPLYERAFAQRPGMFSRSRVWWEERRLADDPERRRGSGPLHRALLELGGEPAGYALYRVRQEWEAGSTAGTVTVQEAVAPSPEATRELWRWLLDFDWTARFAAGLLPLDHPLFLLLAEPRRMRFRIEDGVWVRLVDVQAALRARTYAGDGEVVIEVEDAFLPGNAGRRSVSRAGVENTDAGADLRLDVAALGSAYLGGFSFAELVRASRAVELEEGAAARADALFRTSAAPWCPEIF
ncbi:MAG: GNAT family N-acetyltransferase [Gaiellaceae bacterium]